MPTLNNSFATLVRCALMALLAISLPGCQSEAGSADAASSQAFAGKSLAVAQARSCHDCGTVTRIKKLKQEGDSDGAGMITGAVIGGVLGHQVGSGSGKDIATAAGAVGGAYVGNEAEKDIRAETRYRVYVRMDSDDRLLKIKVKSPQDLRVGDRVRVQDGKYISPL